MKLVEVIEGACTTLFQCANGNQVFSDVVGYGQSPTCGQVVFFN